MKEHRGRLQAQGKDLEESETWARDVEITVTEGLALLIKLRDKLTEAERKLRENAFLNCMEFVNHLQVNGGYDTRISGKPLKKSFIVRGQERVDLEIQSGAAFKS